MDTAGGASSGGGGLSMTAMAAELSLLLAYSKAVRPLSSFWLGSPRCCMKRTHSLARLFLAAQCSREKPRDHCIFSQPRRSICSMTLMYCSGTPSASPCSDPKKESGAMDIGKKFVDSLRKYLFE